MKTRQTSGTIRVLVVDDSAFMRRALTEIIESDRQCRVVKTAADGLAALRAVKQLKPDVVTLDMELPEIDGLACLAYIMNEFPTPVVVVTGFSRYLGEDTIASLEHGAVDFAKKPAGPLRASIDAMRDDLLSKIKLAAAVDVRKLKRVSKAAPEENTPPVPSDPLAASRVVAIASSTGGPRALGEIIPHLPADLDTAVLVVQHMPGEFIPPFAARLDRQSKLLVKVAEDREPISHGVVLMMPDKCHLAVQQSRASGPVMRITPFSPQERNTPFSRADELMTSLAPLYGVNAVGIVLTGMGDDGTEGLTSIHEHGGRTIAEDESTAIIPGMPGSAVRAGAVDRTVRLEAIAREIIHSVNVLPVAVG